MGRGRCGEASGGGGAEWESFVVCFFNFKIKFVIINVTKIFIRSGRKRGGRKRGRGIFNFIFFFEEGEWGGSGALKSTPAGALKIFFGDAGGKGRSGGVVGVGPWGRAEDIEFFFWGGGFFFGTDGVCGSVLWCGKEEGHGEGE